MAAALPPHARPCLPVIADAPDLAGSAPAREFAGHLRLRAAHVNGRTQLAEQSFRAPFHLSKPYWDVDAATLLVQVINPTAGILAGDRLESDISVGPGSSVLVTTPSASRLFTMGRGMAECRQRFQVAPGAWLEVSPEAIVPHRGANFRQETQLEIAAGGRLFWVEQLLPGRVAHGESWAWSRLCLDLSVRYDGELIARERLDGSGAELRALADLARAAASACFANILLIADREASASRWRPALEALHTGETWIGCSALRRTGWSIRIIAADPLRLRDTLGAVRAVLAPFFPALTCRVRKQ